nr:putative ribonuclease H-like domain-containing protein [Tanacetum cinerariifolium]
MRIKQYFLMTDYSLWEVILNGDSPAPTRVVEGVLQPVAPTTAKQKLARKNELKARGTLLMALPDKNQLKFNSHKDAKTLMEAIEKRFGGNTETKKVQKTILKEQYKNFIGSSSESLDQVHDRLQKLISQLEIHRRNKTDLDEYDLDDLFNSLKIYEAEVKSSSSASTTTQNLAFVPSSNTDNTTEPVSAAASVFVASAKIHVSSLPNVDFLSNAVIYSFFASQSSSPQLDSDNLKQIDADTLDEIDLKWQMAMLTVRARRFFQRTGRNLGENRPTSMGFDMSKVEYYNCHKKGYFTRECRSPKDTRRNSAGKPQRRNVPVETSTSNALVSQCDGVGSYDWCFQAEEVPTNYALMAFSSLSSSSGNELRDNALVSLTQNLEKTEQERDDLKLKLEKFQTSSKNLTELLASQTNAKTSLGYNSQVFTCAMFDCDDYLSSGSDESLPLVLFMIEDESETKTTQNVSSFVQPIKQEKSSRHSVQHVETSIPPKTAIPKPTRNGKRNHKQYAQMALQNPQRHMVPAAVLTQSKPVSINVVRPVSTVVPKIKVTRPRHAKPIVTKTNSPPRRHINCSPSPKASNSPPRVTAVKALMVNAAKGMQGKWEWKPKCLILDHVSRNTSASITLKRVIHNMLGKRIIDSGCSRHITENMSYLFDFEELNGGYVSFGGNPKGGKISRKGKIRTGKLEFDDVYFVKELKFNLFSVSQMRDKKNSVLFTDTECLVLSPKFKLLDKNQVLLRVPRENNMYNVNLKNIIPYGDLTCLFAKATINESNLWHRRLGHINFKTMNKLVKGNQTNPSTGFQENFDAEKTEEENDQQYVLFPVWSSVSTNPQNTDGDASFDEKKPEFDEKKPESEVNVSLSSSAQSKKQDDKTKREAKGKRLVESLTGYRNLSVEFKDFSDNKINQVNAVDTLVPTVGQISFKNTNTFSAAGPSNAAASPTHRKSSCIDASQYPDDPDMPELKDITYSDDEDDVGAEADFNNLKTSITEELLQFKMQKVWVLVDLTYGKRAIGTKWVFMNKKDERGIVVRNKARLVTQGHTQKEGIDYEEVFALVARIEAIRLFLSYASFMGFMVYQTDIKSAFLYRTIEEEVYVYQPPGFKDPDHPDKVYKVVKALYGLHQAPRAWTYGIRVAEVLKYDVFILDSRILHFLETHLLRRLTNDGKLRGLGLVKTGRIRIIDILVNRLTLKIHMRSPIIFTVRLIKDQLITLTSLMRTPTTGTTRILLKCLKILQEIKVLIVTRFQIIGLCEELLPGSRLTTNGSQRALAKLELSLDGPEESWRIPFSTQDTNRSSLNFFRRRAHP